MPFFDIDSGVRRESFGGRDVLIGLLAGGLQMLDILPAGDPMLAIKCD
jgi:hypothetical protein